MGFFFQTKTIFEKIFNSIKRYESVVKANTVRIIGDDDRNNAKRAEFEREYQREIKLFSAGECNRRIRESLDNVIFTMVSEHYTMLKSEVRKMNIWDLLYTVETIIEIKIKNYANNNRR